MFDGGSHELPPLAAAFLIEFDNRAGYVRPSLGILRYAATGLPG